MKGKRKTGKAMLELFMASAMILAPWGNSMPGVSNVKEVFAAQNDDWAIYWYLCGSDLESDYGSATEDTAFGEEDMGDGTFVMMFELVDSRNDSATSDVIWFTVEDGEIQAEV